MRVSIDLLTDGVFVSIERTLLRLRNMAIVERCVEAFLGANAGNFAVELLRFLRCDLALRQITVNARILGRKAMIDFRATGMGRGCRGTGQAAENKAQAHNSNNKIAFQVHCALLQSVLLPLHDGTVTGV
jgi:hypothetical protein